MSIPDIFGATLFLGTPLANLWLTQAQTIGLDLPRFADSTGMSKDLIV